MTNIPEIRQMGERSFLVEFEPEISENVLRKVLWVKSKLQELHIKEKLEVTNTFNSLLITYCEAIENPYGVFTELRELLSVTNIAFNFKEKQIEVPVCYDEKFGIDLKEISVQNRLSIEQIIDLHTAAIYRIYFIGFLPGFLYLGGLPEELHFPRRKEPRLEVIKGAVGIGEKQTGIYPQNSPGGWNIIGNSPLELFNPNSIPPCPFSSGDILKFTRVSYEEHVEISDKVKTGEYHLKIKDHGS